MKREAQQMLEYKQKQYVELNQEGGNKSGNDVGRLRDDLSLVRDQIEGLEAHLRKRQTELDSLRQQIEQEKTSR